MQRARVRRRRSDRPLRTRKVSFYVTEEQAESLSQLASRQHRAVAVNLRRLLAAGLKDRAGGGGVPSPRRPQRPPRNTQMSLYVTEEEYKSLDREAQESGLTMSNYLLALVEAGLGVMRAARQDQGRPPR